MSNNPFLHIISSVIYSGIVYLRNVVVKWNQAINGTGHALLDVLGLVDFCPCIYLLAHPLLHIWAMDCFVPLSLRIFDGGGCVHVVYETERGIVVIYPAKYVKQMKANMKSLVDFYM